MPIIPDFDINFFLQQVCTGDVCVPFIPKSIKMSEKICVHVGPLALCSLYFAKQFETKILFANTLDM